VITLLSITVQSFKHIFSTGSVSNVFKMIRSFYFKKMHLGGEGTPLAAAGHPWPAFATPPWVAGLITHHRNAEFFARHPRGDLRKIENLLSISNQFERISDHD
jgi:hypothetical protein